MGELLIIAVLLALLQLLSIPVGLMLFWHCQNQIKALLTRIQDLEKQLLSDAETTNVSSKSERVRGSPPIHSADSTTKDSAADENERQDPATFAQKSIPTPSSALPKAVRQPQQISQWQVQWQSRWQRIEQQLLRNWTGLLGVLAVVAGISFVAISSLLMMEPLQRFLALEAICLAMIAPSFTVKSNHRFSTLFIWMRSGAGGLQLFAAAASSSWPALGLAWNQSTSVGLTLIATAVGFNLLLATITPSQWLAASHVVIAMVPSLVAAPSNSTLFLLAVISALGMATTAGQFGSTRFVIGLSFVGMGWWLNLNPDVSLVGMVTLILASLELSILHFFPPPDLQRSLSWRARCIGLNWTGIALLVGMSPMPWLWPGSGLLAASIGALALAQVCKTRQQQQLLRLNWCAAVGLATLGLGQALAPLNSTLLMLSLMSIVCSAFVWDACRRKELPLIQIAGAGMLLLTSCLLVVLLDDYAAATKADLPLIVLLGLGQQAVIHRGYRSTMPRWIGVAGGWLACSLPLIANALLLPEQARPWAAISVLLFGLHLSGRTGAMATLRVTNVCFSVISWCAIALQLGFTTPSSTDLLVFCGPLIAINVGLIVVGRRLDSSLAGTRSIGMVLGSISLVLTGLTVREAWAWPATGLASLWWLVLALGLIGLACTLTKRALRGESRVLVTLSGAALVSFCLSRLATQPFDDGRVIAVDSAFVALLVLIRAAGHRIAIKDDRIWKAFVSCSGDLAVLAIIVMSATRFTHLATMVVLSALALVAWRGPERPHWPRRIGQGVLLFLVALGALTLISTETQTAMGWIWCGVPVLSAVSFYNAPRLEQSNAGLESEPTPLIVQWINRLETLARRYPQRVIAAPLSIALALMVVQMPTGSTWLTLIWSLEALVLYALSLSFDDKPMRRGALVMLGLCLVRLVGWDMQRADMALRGIVFTGVGVVMITMNVVSTRFER